MQLSLNLKAVISQRLLKKADGSGRTAALEVMLSTPTVRKLILEGQIKKLYPTMQDGGTDGMQTFNQVLEKLVEAQVVTKADALDAASRRDELELARGVPGDALFASRPTPIELDTLLALNEFTMTDLNLDGRADILIRSRTLDPERDLDERQQSTFTVLMATAP